MADNPFLKDSLRDTAESSSVLKELPLEEVYLNLVEIILKKTMSW